jgi:transposase
MVELVRVGRSPAQLSHELGVATQTIPNWVGQAAIDDGKPLAGKEGLTTAEREEIERLRRQLRQVQMERDVLAKAAAWFAGRSDAASSKRSDSRLVGVNYPGRPATTILASGSGERNVLFSWLNWFAS